MSVCFWGCAQTDPKIDINQMEKDIIQKEFGNSFYLNYEHQNCSYEILVNGVPLITFYGLGERSTNASINQYLLTPGKQEITIRMYPKKIEDTKFKPNLDSTSYVKLRLESIKGINIESELYKKEARGRKWTDIFVYQTPKLEEEVPYAEFKVPFEATKDELTWEIKGWKESQTLSNNEALKKEVFEFYNQFQKIIEDQRAWQELKLRFRQKNSLMQKLKRLKNR